jgi:hypothetical protein
MRVRYFGLHIVDRALSLPVRLSPPTTLICAARALVGQRRATIVLAAEPYKRAACPSLNKRKGKEREKKEKREIQKERKVSSVFTLHYISDLYSCK